MVTPPNISRRLHPLRHILLWLCCLQALSPAGHVTVHNIYNNANKVFNLYKGLLTWGLGNVGPASMLQGGAPCSALDLGEELLIEA